MMATHDSQVRGGLSSDEGRRIHVIQGEYMVTDDPNVVLTTILGSCVAACIRDPIARVGGMNHFLLPGNDNRSQEAERYGVHLMELLLNGLLKRGARRDRLDAKLFGGGKTMIGLSDIGSLNAAFAERFLRNEGIATSGGSLRGDRGRRIQFWPISGRVRQVFLANDQLPAHVIRPPAPVLAPSGPSGDVDFF